MSKNGYAYFFFLCVLCCSYSCKTSKIDRFPLKNNAKLSFEDSIRINIEANATFENHFVGLSVYDPATKKYLINYNEKKYFTPASNLKLFSYLASLSILSDSIPTFKYYENGDSLVIIPAGDPSFLGRFDKELRAFTFLKNTKQSIYIHFQAFADEKYGSGWAWDDFPYYYQKEKAAFPIFDNALRLDIKNSADNLAFVPSLFEQFIEVDTSLIKIISREANSNLFRFNDCNIPENYQRNYEIPLVYSHELARASLEQMLQKSVQIIEKIDTSKKLKYIYNIAADSLYKRLLLESDNFVADQLILLCSDRLFGLHSTKKTIKHIKENIFAEMEDDIRWVDGSGLSRYNLVTPRSMVWLCDQILERVSWEKITAFFPSGKEGDTLDGLLNKNYIFAKTGTLSNNHNLSGFVITKSGKKLIFSFMHNHFMQSKADVSKKMYELLNKIQAHY